MLHRHRLHRTWIAALLAMVLGSSGCCCVRSLGLDGFFCPPPSCSSGCGDCGDCGECSDGCGTGRCGLFGSWGCGDVYWGDYASDPPKCCEPCDNQGNWVGPSAPVRRNFRGVPVNYLPPQGEPEAYYESGPVVTHQPQPTQARPKPQTGKLPPGSRSVVR